jgi:phosphoglycolate phosphatase-like HAD superfamily hydrolase
MSDRETTMRHEEGDDPQLRTVDSLLPSAQCPLPTDPPTAHRSLPTALRAVLFDVDGTLVKAARRTDYRRKMHEMLVEIFGTSGRINEVDFAGRTDLSIYREALECEGIGPALIQEKLPFIETATVSILEALTTTGPVFHTCAGVEDLLDALDNDARFAVGLLTGNVERLAAAKLRCAGIDHYFKLRGAFGSDAEDRDHLPAIAARRVIEQLGHNLLPEQFIIVGDTPRDISCARHFGARVVAVASGRHTVEELLELGPDHVLADLADTRAVVELLASI